MDITNLKLIQKKMWHNLVCFYCKIGDCDFSGSCLIMLNLPLANQELLQDSLELLRYGHMGINRSDLS